MIKLVISKRCLLKVAIFAAIIEIFKHMAETSKIQNNVSAIMETILERKAIPNSLRNPKE